MKKFSSYAFWIAFVGALVVFLEDIEALFGIDINTTLVESVILSFCGILVVLGVVHKTTKEDVEENLQEESCDHDLDQNVEDDIEDKIDKDDKKE